MSHLSRLGATVLGLTGLVAFRAGAATPPCDRLCLERFADQYLAATAAHNASHVAVASDVRFVENNQALAWGEGSWQTVTSFGVYRHYFADPETGQVAVITIGRQNGIDMLFDLRLRVVDGRISEAETMISHDPRAYANYEQLGKPDPFWLQAVPESERVSRAALADLADKYFSAMQNNDGKGDYSFFAVNCDRLEHGLRTTNNAAQTYGHSSDSEFVTKSCADQFKLGFLGFVTRIRDRRIAVIDVERQAVFNYAFLDHNGTVRDIMQTNGKNFHIPPYFSVPRTLQVGEAFKAEKGKIRLIEMTLHEFPYGMRPPFAVAAAPLVVSDTAGPRSSSVPSAQPCDRACLEGVTGQSSRRTARSRAHDPTRAPLARAVTFTENDQRLNIGDGLWGTMTDLGVYKLFVADPAAGEIAFVGRIAELDIPGILSLRLKVKNRQISEIDAIVAREEKPGADTLFRPKLLTEPTPEGFQRPAPVSLSAASPAPTSRAMLLAITHRYFDAVEQGRGREVAFAGQCDRRENGVQATNRPKASMVPIDPAKPGFHPFIFGCTEQVKSGFTKYVARIRDRRQPIVDDERGLVFLVAYFDIPGTVRRVDVPKVGPITYPSTLGVPYTLISPHVFKIEGGKIRQIEALGRAAPYRMRSAWLGRHNDGLVSSKHRRSSTESPRSSRKALD